MSVYKTLLKTHPKKAKELKDSWEGALKFVEEMEEEIKGGTKI